MARGDIRQRISLDGGEEVRRQLQQLGAAGEQAAQQIGGAVAAQSGRFTALDGATNKSFATLNRAGTALQPVKTAFADLNTRAVAFGASLNNIATSILPGFASKTTLGVGGLVLAFRQLVTGAGDSVTELSNMSKVSGFSTDTLEGLKDVFEEAGVPIDNLTRLVTRFSEKLGDARLEARKTGGEGIGIVAREVVNGITILRGAETGVQDLGDAFKAAGIDVRNFANTQAGSQAALIAWAKGLSAIRDPTEKARVGQELLGRQWALMGAALIDLDKTLPKAIAENLKNGLGVTLAAQEAARQYTSSVAQLGDAWDETARSIGLVVIPAFTAFLNNFRGGFENLRETVIAWRDLNIAAWQAIFREARNAGVAIGSWFQSNIIQPVNAAIDRLTVLKNTLRDVATGRGPIVPIPPPLSAPLGTIDEATRAMGEQFDLVAGKFKAAADAAVAGGAQVVSGVSQTVENGVTVIRGGAAQMSGAMTSAAGVVRTAMTQTVEAGVNVIRGANLRDVVNKRIREFTAFLQQERDAILASNALITGLLVAQIDALRAHTREVINGQGVGGGGSNILPFAHGGPVRGAGTGISDSILARLSDGEWVSTARAVRYWGTDVFAALNRLEMPRFALGGLADALSAPLVPRSRGYATGGLVAAGTGSSSGTPVHLHLDGHSFALRGEQDVVESLGRHARARRVRSGGRAPGWVG